MTPIIVFRGLRDAADQYLAQCFARETPPHVNELAREVGLTPRSLGRRFKTETGIGVGAYLKHARIERAKRLLAQGELPMAAIAAAAGFGTRATFFAAFKHATGITPVQFRRMKYRNSYAPKSRLDIESRDAYCADTYLLPSAQTESWTGAGMTSRAEVFLSHRTVSPVIAVVVFTLATAVASDNVPSGSNVARRAWQWNDSDRFAERSNDAAAARRAAASKTSGVSSEQIKTPAYDVIDGSRNPELFLEFELFDQMMLGGFAADAGTREAYRLSKDAARKAAGLPADFWDRVGAIAAPYLKDRLEEKRIGILAARSPEYESEWIANTILLCRDRSAAMVELRREFPRLSEFLYSGIAPSMSMTILRRPDIQLQQIARGECR